MPNQRYFGCYIRQRNAPETTPFFIFVAKVRDLREWAGTRRTAEIPSGTQRLLKPTRVNAIKRFLGSNSINTIPNSVLLAFEPDNAKFTPFKDECMASEEFYNNCPQDELVWGFLEFSFEEGVKEYERPALIVDGQHRIKGISSFEQENLPVLVVGLVNANHQEQAFQFIVVNDKAVKVATENVKSIIADFDEGDLQSRLFSAGIRYGELSPKLKDVNDLPTSPFQNLFDWAYNREGEKIVSVTAIEQGLKYLENKFGNVIGDDEGSVLDIYCAIWRGVRSRYTDLWGQKNRFMTKVNLNAMNELIIRHLKTLWGIDLLDIFNVDEVEAKVTEMWKSIPSEYWILDWSVTPQDTTGFKEFIQADLDLISENIRLKKSWYEGLQLPQISE